MNRAFVCLMLTLLACCEALAFQRGPAVEDAPVADDLTIADYLVSGSNNNIDTTATLTNAITVTAGSPTVTITQTSHGRSVGNPVSFYGSTVVGGLSIDGGWTVTTVPNANTFTITHTANANATIGPTGTTIITNPTSWQDDGKLRFLCKFSHLSYDDPILFPGTRGATHGHLFFGNTLANYASTYSSLRAAGNGTCQGGPLNRTAYWMPWMQDASIDKVRIPVFTEWYYVMNRADLRDRLSPICASTGLLQDGRPAACPQYAIKKLERGAAAVYGFQIAVGDYPTTYVGPYRDILATAWSCLDVGGTPQGGSYRYLHHTGTPSLGLSSNVLCPASGFVRVRTSSPGCWNGVHAGASTYNNYATYGNDGFGNIICPATHPYRFMQFTIIVDWSYTGGISQLSNWFLSSDRFNGATYQNGESFHWDMLWAWNDAIQAHFHKNIHAMFPKPDSSTHVGGPYVNSWIGTGTALGNTGLTAAGNWVGGPFMRNTNSGGLSGNSGIGDCTALGIVGKCSLNAASGLSDILVDVPTPPYGTYP